MSACRSGSASPNNPSASTATSIRSRSPAPRRLPSTVAPDARFQTAAAIAAGTLHGGFCIGFALLMGVDGYTFGLGFMVRQGPGLAGVPGSEGEYMWAGAGGTFFWIDPKEQLAVVYTAQTPGAIRPYYRRMIKALVAQALDSGLQCRPVVRRWRGAASTIRLTLSASVP
jgi:CubicO group peptidase (beta-lactamase class C family)